MNERTESILTAWGQVYAGALTAQDPISVAKKFAGMRRAEMLLVLASQEMHAFVCSTAGYARAEPVLAHVYARTQSLEDFRMVEPGETRLTALVRLGWLHGSPSILLSLADDVNTRPPNYFPRLILNEFLAKIDQRIESETPVFADQIEYHDDPDQGPATDGERLQMRLIQGIDGAISQGQNSRVCQLWETLKKVRAGDLSEITGKGANSNLQVAINA